MPTAKPRRWARATVSAIIALTACGDPSQTLPPPPSSPTATADPTETTSAAPSPDTIPIVPIEHARGGAEVIIPDPCPEADEISILFNAREEPQEPIREGEMPGTVRRGFGPVPKASLERISVTLPDWYEPGWTVLFEVTCLRNGLGHFFDSWQVVLQ